MISKAEWQSEREWLEKVLEIVREQLELGREQSKKFREEVRTNNRWMWEDTFQAMGDFEEDFDMMLVSNQYMKERKVKTLTYNFYRTLVRRLEKMEQTPYFGRIDFREAGEEEAEKIYIGLATLFNQEEDCLIYDWRTPISSMFYDYQPGPTSYECAYGSVEGEMTLKRQYKIVAGQILYMFDTNIKIDDDILQSILGQHSSGKMKQIVTSIQKEQNQVIRDEEHQLLIVQGAAGSGKTSIALHRIAYLLYTYRKTLRSDNILILSPNYIFSDYISNVLPELGEENMRQITFHEYGEIELGPKLKIEDVNDQLEYFLSQPQESAGYQDRVRGTQYKASMDFVQVVKNYIGYFEENGVNFMEISCCGETIVTQEELLKLWRKYTYLPFAKRLNKIQGRIRFILRKFKKKQIRRLYQDWEPVQGEALLEGIRTCIATVRAEVVPLRKRVAEMISFDFLKMYLKLFEDVDFFRQIAVGTELPEGIEKICAQTLENFSAGKVGYDDLIPLLYFKVAITGDSILKREIKHVVIDEAQDYSPFHYELIRFLFPESNLTLLGDLNQSIHPYVGIGQYQRIEEIFQVANSHLVQLKKSYRSTTEISNFAQGVLPGDPDIQTVERPGAKPQVIQIADSAVVSELLVQGVRDYQEKGAESIAVICKTAAESLRIYDLLRERLEIDLVNQETFELNRKLVVIPSYLAKGLEFDGVLVYMSPEGNYFGDDEARLFYTVCTRALHDLRLYTEGELSPFITNLDPALYERAKYTLVE